MLTAAACLAANFDDAGRWTTTAANPVGLQRGDGLILSWGIVPDGTSIADPFAAGTVKSSNIIGFLDTRYGGAPGGNPADLTLRPWFAILQDSLAVIAAKTGISYVYQPDDGAAWGSGGAPNARGDVRIGGFDVAPGYLGFNAFPAAGGDMVLDTGAGNPFGNPTDLRNVFLHEHGHGLGLGHVDLPGANAMMEANFNGPQYDDLWALQRMYGDKYEKGAGNDTASASVPIGNPLSGVLGIGDQANDQTILAAETNVVSIDGASDVDFYKFTTSAAAEVDVTVFPRGPTYSYTPEGAGAQTHTGVNQSDLRFDLYAADGATPLYQVNASGLGGTEQLSSVKLPAAGDYHLRVSGQQDRTQMYELRVAATVAPTPANPNLVFDDGFGVAGGASADANAQYNAAGRQASGLINSLYRISSSDTTPGDTTVSIDANQLSLTSTGDDSGPNQGTADLSRNLAPELAGTRWSASFSVDLSGDAGIGDSWFGFTFNDAAPPSGPFAESAEMSMLIRLGGALQIKENAGNAPGEADFLGSVAGLAHRVELQVDETGLQPLMSLIVDDVLRVDSEPITLAANGRYFSFRTHVGAGESIGLTFNALVDDFTIEYLANPTLPADFNRDDRVDGDDLLLWRTHFGTPTTAETGDADSDGDADGADFLVWQRQLVGNTGAAALPEPRTAYLLAIALSGILGVIRAGVRRA